MGTDGHEDRVEASIPALGFEVRDPVATGDLYAQRVHPVDLTVEDVARQPVGRDPVAHHPAGFIAGIADLHLVPEPRQVAGSREAAWTGAYHQHPPSRPAGRSLQSPAALERQIAEKPLDGVDRH